MKNLFTVKSSDYRDLLSKFCTQVAFYNNLAYGWQTTAKRDVRGQSHMTRFFKYCRNHMIGNGEAKHFKFRLLIDTFASS